MWHMNDVLNYNIAYRPFENINEIFRLFMRKMCTSDTLYGVFQVRLLGLKCWWIFPGVHNFIITQPAVISPYICNAIRDTILHPQNKQTHIMTISTLIDCIPNLKNVDHFSSYNIRFLAWSIRFLVTSPHINNSLQRTYTTTNIIIITLGTVWCMQ